MKNVTNQRAFKICLKEWEMLFTVIKCVAISLDSFDGIDISKINKMFG